MTNAVPAAVLQHGTITVCRREVQSRESHFSCGFYASVIFQRTLRVFFFLTVNLLDTVKASKPNSFVCQTAAGVLCGLGVTFNLFMI